MKECPECQRCFDDDAETCPVDGARLQQGVPGPTLLGDKYLVKRRLATGGMGAVYSGVDQKLKRPVALKGINDPGLLDEHAKARLLREARIISQLDNPAICRIYDFFEDPRGTFLVLELVHGRTLGEVLRENRLSRFEKMEIAFMIANVLATAHAAGIVHRDLKPDNVMITPEGKLKVLDFGVARPLGLTAADGSDGQESSMLTLPGLILGTPEYMSPEQAQNGELTAASDMYSFGLLLQELFTGRPAYPPNLTIGELLLMVARGQTQEPEGLDGDLGDLVRRLKSLQPTVRPTAVDTIAHLRWIRDKPRRRLGRRVRTATIVALAAAAAALGLFASRVRDASHRADRELRKARAGQLAAEAAVLREHELDRSLLLSLLATELDPGFETHSELFASLEASPRIERYLRGHPARVGQVSWGTDGRLAAASDGTIHLWDALRGELLGEIPTAPGGLRALAFRPDGKLLAGGGDDAVIRFWDPDARERVGTALVGHQGPVHDLVWSPDGSLLASSSADGTLRLWKPFAGQPRQVLRVGPGEARALAWSADGTVLASAGDSGTLRLWDLAAGGLRFPPWDAGQGPLGALAFGGGTTLASAGADGSIRLWDAATGRGLGETLRSHPSGVTSLAMSPDGATLAAGVRDARVWLFHLEDFTGSPLAGHGGAVLSLAWSRDGRRLASAGTDRSVVVWATNPDPFATRGFAHRGWITCLAVSADRALLASASTDGTVKLWDTAGNRLRGQPLHLDDGPVRSLAVATDATLVAAGGAGGQVALWDLQTGKPRFSLRRAHQGPVLALAFPPDGAFLLSGGADGRIRIWDAATGEPRGPPLVHRDAVVGLAVSPGGKLLASGGGLSVRLWDLGTRREVQAIEGKGSPRWSADGAALSFLDLGGGVLSWDVDARAPRLGPLGSLSGTPVRVFAFRADELFLATASDGPDVVLWDTAAGAPRLRISGRRGPVKALAWVGDVLAVGGADGSVTLHDVGGGAEDWRRRACERAGRDLTETEWGRYMGAEEHRPLCPGLPPS